MGQTYSFLMGGSDNTVIVKDTEGRIVELTENNILISRHDVRPGFKIRLRVEETRLRTIGVRSSQVLAAERC